MRCHTHSPELRLLSSGLCCWCLESLVGVCWCLHLSRRHPLSNFTLSFIPNFLFVADTLSSLIPFTSQNHGNWITETMPARGAVIDRNEEEHFDMKPLQWQSATVIYLCASCTGRIKRLQDRPLMSTVYQFEHVTKVKILSSVVKWNCYGNCPISMIKNNSKIY